MVRTIPLNGNPNGQVFGTIGSLIEMSDGLKYVKVSDDSLNIGWESYNATPTPTPTPTVTPTPTPTVTPVSTATPTPTPTGAPTSTPTPTPTVGGGSRVLSSLTPIQYGKSSWDLDVDGPLYVYNPTLIFSSSFCYANFEINAAYGGNGGDDDFQGGQGSFGNRMIFGVIMSNSVVYSISNGQAGESGTTGTANTGGGGGTTGATGKNGGDGGDAGPDGFSGGGGGGGGATILFGNGSPIAIVGGGGGGGGGGQYSQGQDANWGVPSWNPSGMGGTYYTGSDGADATGDGGGGGGGGGFAGSGGAGGGDNDFGGEAGTNGYMWTGSIAALVSWQTPSSSSGNGFVKIY